MSRRGGNRRRDTTIRRLFYSGISWWRLCEMYGLSRSRVYQIINGYRLRKGVKVHETSR